MAKVNFLRGLFSDYSKLATKDTGTLYITGATADSFDSIYLGEHLLGSSSAENIKFNYSAYPNHTSTVISGQTTLLGVIRALENRMTDIAGGSHSVLSVAGLTGEIDIVNTFYLEEETPDYSTVSNGEVYVLSNGIETLQFGTKISTAALFGTTESVTGVLVTGDDGSSSVQDGVPTETDLLQIVADETTSSDSIHLAKLRLKLCNSAEETEDTPETFISDGLVLMNDVSRYVSRIFNKAIKPEIASQVATAISTHKSESNAHALAKIGGLSSERINFISTTINSTTDRSPDNYGLSTGWASIANYIDLDVITDRITNIGSFDAESAIMALFEAFSKSIKGTIDASTYYTDTQIASVAIEWGTIA